jgi:hypothetical protein
MPHTWDDRTGENKEGIIGVPESAVPRMRHNGFEPVKSTGAPWATCQIPGSVTLLARRFRSLPPQSVRQRRCAPTPDRNRKTSDRLHGKTLIAFGRIPSQHRSLQHQPLPRGWPTYAAFVALRLRECRCRIRGTTGRGRVRRALLACRSMQSHVCATTVSSP